MRISLVAILTLTFSFFFAACTTVTPYQPTEKMSAQDASDIAEELIMSAENYVRPDWVKINDSYITLNFGSVSEGNHFSITTRNRIERINLKSVINVELLEKNWTKIFKFKFKTECWVQINLNNNKDIGETKKFIYHSKNVEDAKRLVDALETLKLAYQMKSAGQYRSTEITKDPLSTSQKLRELQNLKNDGLITEEEYQQKRKLLVEHL